MTIYNSCGFPFTTFPGFWWTEEKKQRRLSRNSWCPLLLSSLSHGAGQAANTEIMREVKYQVTSTPRSFPYGWAPCIFILLALLFSLPSRVTSGPVNIGKLSVHIYYEITRCWKPPAPALNIIWVLLDNLLLLSSTHKEKNAEARKAKCGVATRNSITSRNVHTIHCLWQLQRADWDDELLQESRPHFTFTLLSFWAAPLT